MYRKTSERPSQRHTRSDLDDMEVKFLKPPPKNEDFIENSDSDSECEAEWRVNYLQQASLNRDGPFVEEDHSGTYLPDHPRLEGPALYAGYRPITVLEGSIPNLDVLASRNSSECLPRPFTDQDDTLPDLSILRVREDPSKRRARPFSAKPRVFRKYRLRTDQKAHEQQTQSQVTSMQAEENDSNNSEDLDTELTLDDDDENIIIPFSQVKWLLPNDDEKPRKPPEPERTYPYTKLQPLPTPPIRCVDEDDEGEYLVSTARLNRARNSRTANEESDTEENKEHTKPGPSKK